MVQKIQKINNIFKDCTGKVILDILCGKIDIKINGLYRYMGVLSGLLNKYKYYFLCERHQCVRCNPGFAIVHII